MAVSELGKRLAVAALAIPLVVAAVWLGSWVLGVVLAAAAAGAAGELYRLAARQGVQPFTVPGCLLAAAFPLIATPARDVAAASAGFWAALLLAVLLLAAAAIWRRGVAGRPLGAVAVSVLGAVLTGGTLAYAVFLRRQLGLGSATGHEAALTGSLLVGFPLILTWVSDSGAYFGGHAFGRHKLIPAVSPGKTVEGAVAGVVSTVLAGVFYAWLLGRSGLSLSLAAGAGGGALISVVAQVGDLSESLLKREAGIKDSGRFFPGHGGIYDRVDSLLFTVPVAYWYLWLIQQAM